MLKAANCARILALASVTCFAQKPKPQMPESLVIARRSFIDVGPPFNFYDLTQVSGTGKTLYVERVFVTPPGQSCLQPATVEFKTATLQKSMTDLLMGRNPCAIPDKQLRRELKRRKRGLVFSGYDLVMEISCDGRPRQLRMDILDRDMFAAAPNTPVNTSWSMALLSELDESLGRGLWDRPMFNFGSPEQKPASDTALVRDVKTGKFDNLFGNGDPVSQIARDADKPPGPPPSVAIGSITPTGPISPEIPVYPPIAKAARVGGLVSASFGISPEGKVENVKLDGPKMLQQAVRDAVSVWQFPQSAWGKSARAEIQFQLNCLAQPAAPGR